MFKKAKGKNVKYQSLMLKTHYKDPSTHSNRLNCKLHTLWMLHTPPSDPGCCCAADLTGTAFSNCN